MTILPPLTHFAAWMLLAWFLLAGLASFVAWWIINAPKETKR